MDVRVPLGVGVTVLSPIPGNGFGYNLVGDAEPFGD